MSQKGSLPVDPGSTRPEEDWDGGPTVVGPKALLLGPHGRKVTPLLRAVDREPTSPHNESLTSQPRGWGGQPYGERPLPPNPSGNGNAQPLRVKDSPEPIVNIPPSDARKALDQTMVFHRGDFKRQLDEEDTQTKGPALAESVGLGDEALLVQTRPHHRVLLLSPSSPLQIGRGPDSAGGLQFTDLAFSRKHASISFTHSSYYITDLGSGNGTWVNNEQLIGLQPFPLMNGDWIEFPLSGEERGVRLRFTNRLVLPKSPVVIWSEVGDKLAQLESLKVRGCGELGQIRQECCNAMGLQSNFGNFPNWPQVLQEMGKTWGNEATRRLFARVIGAAQRIGHRPEVCTNAIAALHSFRDRLSAVTRHNSQL